MRLVLGIAFVLLRLSIPGVYCSSKKFIRFMKRDAAEIQYESEKEKAANKAAENAFMCIGKVFDKVAESVQSINGVFTKKGTVAHCAKEDKEDIEKKIEKHLDGVPLSDVIKKIINNYMGDNPRVGLLHKPLKSYYACYSDSLIKICESLGYLVGFTNLFLVPLKQCEVGLDKADVVLFGIIEEIRVKFDELFKELEDRSLVLISTEKLTEISNFSTKMNESVKSLCENAVPEGIDSELYKLVLEREGFTTKKFCEAIGLRVELKKTKEMKPGDSVAGSKSLSLAEPGKEVRKEVPNKEMQSKEVSNEEVQNKEVREEVSNEEVQNKEVPDKEVPDKEMQSKEVPDKEVPNKEEAESWFAKNRVWVLIVALVVVVLAAVYYIRRSNK